MRRFPLVLAEADISVSSLLTCQQLEGEHALFRGASSILCVETFGVSFPSLPVAVCHRWTTVINAYDDIARWFGLRLAVRHGDKILVGHIFKASTGSCQEGNNKAIALQA